MDDAKEGVAVFLRKREQAGPEDIYTEKREVCQFGWSLHWAGKKVAQRRVYIGIGGCRRTCSSSLASKTLVIKGLLT